MCFSLHAPNRKPSDVQNSLKNFESSVCSFLHFAFVAPIFCRWFLEILENLWIPAINKMNICMNIIIQGCKTVKNLF